MAGGKRDQDNAPPAAADPPDRLPLPSPNPATNLVIADLALRVAGAMLRNRMEKGLLKAGHDGAEARRLVTNRSLLASMALWGASRMARRSPVGRAVVTGALAVKVLYDRGKELEGQGKPARGKSKGTKP